MLFNNLYYKIFKLDCIIELLSNCLHWSLHDEIRLEFHIPSNYIFVADLELMDKY